MKKLSEDQRCLDWVNTADATSDDAASNKKLRSSSSSRLSETEMFVLQLVLVAFLAVLHVSAGKT